ncbi:MAG: CxxxxCH/CxxCH domain-containing protein, partial [Thermodesulfovibrionales bacterium]
MQGIDKFDFETDKNRCRGGAKGLALFAAVLLLVFIATGAYADQICSDCHDTAQHNVCDAGNCAACHGNPPVNAGGLIHPYANMTGPVASGSASAGAHAKHATPSGSNYACDTCHYNGMSASSGQLIGGTNNGNGILQMGFNISGSGGGVYDGHTLNPPYTYEGTNGTTVTAGGTMTCSNIYCHSDGTSVATGVIQPHTSPSWNVTGPLACN